MLKSICPRVSGTALALLMTSSVLGQGSAVMTFEYPAGEELPWKALRPSFAPTGNTPPGDPAEAFCGDGWQAIQNYPWGYPNCQGPGNWVTLADLKTGYIDDDEHLDFLVVMSTRLILAMGLDDHDAQGNPTPTAKPYCIWAWWDDDATFYKHSWSKDAGVIADFDGDGRQEVAVIVGPPKNIDYSDGTGYDQVSLADHWPIIMPNDPATQKRIMIFGTASPGEQVGDPSFGGVTLPKILDWKWMNDQPCDPGISSSIEPNPGGTGGDNHHVKAGQFTDSPGYEIFLHLIESGRPKVFSWGGTFGSMQNEFCAGWFQYGFSNASHTLFTMDLNGDGYDEILLSGVIDIANGTQWFLHDVPEYVDCTNQSATTNHPDSLVPLDTDGDGRFDMIYLADDCNDMMVPINPDDLGEAPTVAWVNDGPTRICDLNDGPYVHGQALSVARLFDGPDPSGYEGMHLIVTPKEYGGLYGNGSHSSVTVTPVPNAAGEMDEITYNRNRDLGGNRNYDGPGQFGPINLDWDGDRSTDEMLDTWGADKLIYRLVNEPYFPSFCTPSDTYDYRWDLVASQVMNVSDLTVVDVLGDYRDEVVLVSGTAVNILYNTDPNPDPSRHLKPLRRDAAGNFLDEAYLRRLMDTANRPMDYQHLMTLDRLEVVPHTATLRPGQTVTYQALAIYRNAAGVEETVDMTDDVAWISGNPAMASFTGSQLTVHTEGYAAVRATLNGTLNNGNPALVVGTTDSAPRILYAGYGDMYIESDIPSSITLRARISDLEGDVPYVILAQAPVVKLRDNGLGGDVQAGDGLFTWRGPSSLVPQAPGDSYITLYAVDDAANLSNIWPYLAVGGWGPLPASGFGTMPFASEAYGFGPRLRGVGHAVTSLEPNVPGAITMIAEASADPITGIFFYTNQATEPIGQALKDNGLGADQLAGDGLWTAQKVMTLPGGLHQFDFIPFKVNPLLVGDVQPRFRVHEVQP